MRHYEQKYHEFMQNQERNYIADMIAMYSKAAEMTDEAEDARDINRMHRFIMKQMPEIRERYLFQLDEFVALQNKLNNDMSILREILKDVFKDNKTIMAKFESGELG